jgi:uncharacterized integral membrane protein (TIGR00698 family)
MTTNVRAVSHQSSGFIVTLLPGVAFAALVAGLAMLVEAGERALIGQPVMEALVAAIVIGMILRNSVGVPASIERGAAYAAKQLLEVGVLLLGFTIDLRQVLAAGPLLLLVIAFGVSGGIIVSFGLGRLLGLPIKLAALVAVGNAICGNSAIAAVAPVIRAEKKDVATAIALTAIVGVTIILTLPLLIPLAHLTFYQYGVLAGMSVYAVPQVIAASYPVSQISGDVATLVKLVRVLFLGPVALVIGILSRRAVEPTARGKQPAYVPWFITGFVLLAIVRYTGFVPVPALTAAQTASRLLMVLAMAGLGLGVEFAALRKVGPRVIVAVFGSLTFLICLSLALIRGLGIAG